MTCAASPASLYPDCNSPGCPTKGVQPPHPLQCAVPARKCGPRQSQTPPLCHPHRLSRAPHMHRCDARVAQPWCIFCPHTEGACPRMPRRCLSLPARTLSQDKKQIELYTACSPPQPCDPAGLRGHAPARCRHSVVLVPCTRPPRCGAPPVPWLCGCVGRLATWRRCSLMAHNTCAPNLALTTP